ncbi:retrotransposon protein, putative, ty3-gypsy subclass [Tanacetum coccineum]
MSVADALQLEEVLTLACLKIQLEIIKDLELMEFELVVRGSECYIASLKIEPNLILRIKEAQKEDGELWSVVQNMKNGKQEEFRVDEHGVIWNGGLEFRSKVLKRVNKIKSTSQRASGLLQPLDIPTWKWEQISMDFVTRLPRTFKKNDAIWVVVDRLTKSAHFLPIQQGYSGSKLAEIFQQEIIRLHGTPASIVLDMSDERSTVRLLGMKIFKGAPVSSFCMAKVVGSTLFVGTEVGERVIEGPELVEVTNEKVAIAKEKLKEYVNSFLRCALPPQLSHVHNVFHVTLLRGYNYHPYHVVQYPLDKIREDLSFVEEPEAIFDRQRGHDGKENHYS